MTRRRLAAIAVAATLWAPLAACDDAGEGALDPDIAAGCAHFDFGSESLLVALASGTDVLETLSVPHQRYVISFEDTAADHYGYLDFAPAAAARYLLLLDADVPLVLTDLASNEVSPARIERQSPACAGAAVIYTFDLEPSVYTLTLGPTDATGLTAVLHQPPDADADAGAHQH
jgi:hypothetical protein